MFNSKKTNLFENRKNTSVNSSTMSIPTNPFLNEGIKESSKTLSGNGSLKYKTSGSDFVDDFSNLSGYKSPRNYNDISNTMSLQWSQNPELTVRMAFYTRMITRVVQLPNGEKIEGSQRGQGLKHEGIFRMLWLALNHEDTFWKNIPLIPTVGSWKDIFQMLSIDLQYNGWDGRKLNWDNFGKLILVGLENPNTTNLVKKYLPQIKPNNKCNTLESQANNIIAKWLCSLLFGGKSSNPSSTYKRYRKLKTSGTAHEWQQLISQGKHDLVNFDTIHGRALSLMVSGKYLKNQKLEDKFETWIKEKPSAKYTGYVYELFKPLGIRNYMNASSLSEIQKHTINKQFYELVNKAKDGLKEGENGLIGVLDTSGSMMSEVPGTGVSSYSVGKSLTLFMSHMLDGKFNSCYLEFSNSTVMKQWKGSTPIEQLCNDNSSIIGSTNFVSIADNFGKILKSGVDEKEFPSGIVCFSDGEFNGSNNKSAFKSLKEKLLNYGFSKKYVDNFKVILWDIRNYYYGRNDGKTKFEDFANTPNLFYISGLDAGALAFLTGTTKLESIPKNSDELFQAAMSQEILDMVQI
jgi:hypothetical protein